MVRRPLPPDLTAGAIALAFALICTSFAWQPELASFADDSASYLVMAQVFSPWQLVPQPIAEAYVREAFYPPLFPALLALAGAGNDIGRAHAVSALLLACALPVAYVVGVRWLHDRRAALAVVVTTALLPSLWIHVKGILSEPLFCFLFLAILALLETEKRSAVLLALAMAALSLTRTVGLIVLAAYAAHALMHSGMGLRQRAQRAWPALAGIAAYAVWVLVRPAEAADVNVRFMAERGQAIFASPSMLAALGASMVRQANALGEAWIGALMVFWVPGRVVPLVIASGLGMLSLAGLLARLRARSVDAWMTAAYLLTFLLWPFHDQMTRFLFPVLPVLVLYGFWAIAGALRRSARPVAAASLVLSVVFASLSVPALAFIYQRARSPEPYARMTDWYRTPDLDQARSRAQVHLGLLADMHAIGRLTQPQDHVMWVAPSYIALLANRHGVPAPEAELPPERYRAVVGEKRPDYVFLSLYHPRDTLSDRAWQTGIAAMTGSGTAVHVNTRPDGVVSSVLLKLKADELVALGAAGH